MNADLCLAGIGLPTIYTTLGRLESRGLVVSEVCFKSRGDGNHRRYHEATPRAIKAMRRIASLLKQRLP